MGVALLGGKRSKTRWRAVREGEVDTLILLENNLFHRLETTALDALLHGVKHVIALDFLRECGDRTGGDGAAGGDVRRSGRHAGEQ